MIKVQEFFMFGGSAPLKQPELDLGKKKVGSYSRI